MPDSADDEMWFLDHDGIWIPVHSDSGGEPANIRKSNTSKKRPHDDDDGDTHETAPKRMMKTPPPAKVNASHHTPGDLLLQAPVFPRPSSSMPFIEDSSDDEDPVKEDIAPQDPLPVKRVPKISPQKKAAFSPLFVPESPPPDFGVSILCARRTKVESEIEPFQLDAGNTGSELGSGKAPTNYEPKVDLHGPQKISSQLDTMFTGREIHPSIASTEHEPKVDPETEREKIFDASVSSLKISPHGASKDHHTISENVDHEFKKPPKRHDMWFHDDPASPLKPTTPGRDFMPIVRDRSNDSAFGSQGLFVDHKSRFSSDSRDSCRPMIHPERERLIHHRSGKEQSHRATPTDITFPSRRHRTPTIEQTRSPHSSRHAYNYDDTDDVTFSHMSRTRSFEHTEAHAGAEPRYVRRKGTWDIVPEWEDQDRDAWRDDHRTGRSRSYGGEGWYEDRHRQQRRR